MKIPENLRQTRKIIKENFIKLHGISLEKMSAVIEGQPRVDNTEALKADAEIMEILKKW